MNFGQGLYKQNTVTFYPIFENQAARAYNRCSRLLARDPDGSLSPHQQPLAPWSIRTS